MKSRELKLKKAPSQHNSFGCRLLVRDRFVYGAVGTPSAHAANSPTHLPSMCAARDAVLVLAARVPSRVLCEKRACRFLPGSAVG